MKSPGLVEGCVLFKFKESNSNLVFCGIGVETDSYWNKGPDRDLRLSNHGMTHREQLRKYHFDRDERNRAKARHTSFSLLIVAP